MNKMKSRKDSLVFHMKERLRVTFYTLLIPKIVLIIKVTYLYTGMELRLGRRRIR